MTGRFREYNFIWLTLALIGLMLGGALSRSLPDSMTLQIFEVGSVTLLMLSLLSLKSARRWMKWLILIIGIMLSTVVAQELSKNIYYEYFYLALLFLFLALTAWMVGRVVLFSGNVNFNVVIGSVSLYLLIGLLFSIIYTVLLEFSPMAIKGIEVAHWYDNLPQTTYFSFVTLTTLGYGDMSPLTHLSEVIVVIEAVTGMFYFAIIVASLVGGLKNRPPADR
jgi:hypothetical protein